MHKLIILIFLFIVSFSSLNANEITFDIGTIYREATDDNGDFNGRYKSDPLNYSIGIKNWDKGIFNKIKPPILEKWRLLYSAEYTIVNSLEYADKNSFADIKGTKERYEIYISRDLTSNIKVYAGYGFRRIKLLADKKFTNTGTLMNDEHLKTWYHPIGIIWNIKNNWTLKSQYNLWNHGYDKDLAAYEATYPIDYGWGADFNLSKLITNKISLFSYYRYWDADASDIRQCDSSGSLCIIYATETTEIGGGISYKF